MKKLIALLLVLALAVSLAACGAEENSDVDMVITRAPEAATEAPAEENEAAEETAAAQATGITGPYTFVAEGVKLIPGAAFDASLLPETDTPPFEQPSCAFQGMDITYSYGTFEITTYDEGAGEFIQSILFIDPNLTTPEGLALGDSLEKMESLYGTGYEVTGDNYVYTNGETQLSIMAPNGTVNYIEYRLAI